MGRTKSIPKRTKKGDPNTDCISPTDLSYTDNRIEHQEQLNEQSKHVTTQVVENHHRQVYKDKKKKHIETNQKNARESKSHNIESQQVEFEIRTYFKSNDEDRMKYTNDIIVFHDHTEVYESDEDENDANPWEENGFETFDNSCVPIRKFYLPQIKLMRVSKLRNKNRIISSEEKQSIATTGLQKVEFNKEIEITSTQAMYILLSYYYTQSDHIYPSEMKSKDAKKRQHHLDQNPPRHEADYISWYPSKGTKYDEDFFSHVMNAITEGIFRFSIYNVPNKERQPRITGKSNQKESIDEPCIVMALSLTPYAFITCTPQNIPKSPPLPSTSNNLTKTNRSYYISRLLLNAMGFLFPNTVLEDVWNDFNSKKEEKRWASSQTKITARMVYEKVDNAHMTVWAEKKNKNVDNPNKGKQDALDLFEENCFEIDGLIPTLRIYQEEALKWMLKREKLIEKDLSINAEDKNHKASEEDKAWELCWLVVTWRPEMNNGYVMPLHEFRRKEEGDDLHQYDEMNMCIYSPFAGWLCKNIEEARTATISRCGEIYPSEVSGGILADSMGLGKTVEVLACILSNKCSDHSPSRFVHKPIHLKQDSKERDNIVQIRDDFEDSVCICGRSGKISEALSWVRCENCHEVMHGVCAGFQSEAQILAETVGGYCSASRCPCCFSLNHKVPGKQIQSRGTLIITPPSILNQWEREINRHTYEKSRLKILIYPGVREICNTANSFKATNHNLIHPQILADADIVLMSFSSLMNELGHSSENPFLSSSRKQLRKRKRYRVVPSPLTSIKWWRICLDEAQNVETPTASSARMALQLSSVHKWCITGTPLGKGDLEDLYGLLLFLRVNPFRDQSLFRSCFKRNHRGVMERIAHLLRAIFWRSTKANKDVRDQLGIPEQEERKVWLKFSSIERHFYQLQLEQTILASTNVVKDPPKKKQSYRTAKKKADILNNQLHKLRAACCHPQVGSSGIGRILQKSNSVSSGVLSMEQILDRLIDNAKTKCEESQRVCILHSNVLACLNRLKVESRIRNDLQSFNWSESDEELLVKGTNIYKESLELTDQNSTPINVVGEGILSGCKGFEQTREVARDGKVNLSWKLQKTPTSRKEIWARIDFDGPAKKITAMKVKQCFSFEDEDNVQRIYPKDCILQVSSAAVGGEFVDACRFTLNETKNQTKSPSWEYFKDFQTNKSKNWRVLIQNYHNTNQIKANKGASSLYDRYIIGIGIQLMEPSISTDSLQRLHILNNTVIMMNLLEQKLRSCKEKNIIEGKVIEDHSNHDSFLKQREVFETECHNLESLYLAYAQNLHHESQRRLKETNSARRKCNEELRSCSSCFSQPFGNQKISSRPWWEDLLSWCSIYGNTSQEQSLCEVVKEDLFDLFEGSMETSTVDRVGFPDFQSVEGLQSALKLRIEAKNYLIDAKKLSCIDDVSLLSSIPSTGEILENSQCHKCRSDWFQKGPECRHCKLETRILHLENGLRDSTITCVLKSLSKWCNSTSSNQLSTGSEKINNEDHKFLLKSFIDRSIKYFELHVALKKEISDTKLAWRTHFDLLSDYDELNQCKQSMRLPYANEDLTGLTEHERGSVVEPCDIGALTMEHSAKQAMVFAELRRNKQTLRFLRNQSLDRRKERESLYSPNLNLQKDNFDGNDKITCVVCLSDFGKENKAVLSCGHFFHYSPCLESLMKRTGNKNIVSCPMRCTVRTKREDILIATEIPRGDNGNRIQRPINGSWGTKVDRLVADILDVVDLGEKSIVFSQWDDMLTIVEKALSWNNIGHIKVKGIRNMGKHIKQFRMEHCSVLLLNVKNGAEGLTLIEATHVFMIEPLLNCGLDMQAINRIHRIGQKFKTHVHRYIVKDTIEEKIDKLRMERQGNMEKDLDSNNDNKECSIFRAGGIDGGFSQDELHEILG